MACYIMVLRTIEITASHIYDRQNPPILDKNNREVHVPAIIKLNWINSQKLIRGSDFKQAKAFIEARNEGVHEVYVPEEIELMSVFNTVIRLVLQLKEHIVSPV